MLAIFCDLTIKDQADFRPWLDEEMFPARLKIGFKNCGSFNLLKGEGSNFVTLYEVPSLGYLYDLPYQELRQTRTSRDAEYHKKFQNPERYTLSWIGPEIRKKTPGFAPYISIDRFNLGDNLIEEFNTWFVNSFIPALTNSDNILGLRRYISVEGPHQHFTIQEHLNPQINRNDIDKMQKTKFGKNISGIYERVIQRS